MMKAYNQQRVNGGNLTAIITSFGLQRAFFNLLQSKVQYVTPTKLSGGFQSLDFQGMPLIADIDAPFGKMYYLDESTLKVFSNRDWHFLDEDGNVLKWTNGFDSWDAVLGRYMNLGATRRNNQFVLSGLTDTTGV